MRSPQNLVDNISNYWGGPSVMQLKCHIYFTVSYSIHNAMLPNTLKSTKQKIITSTACLGNKLSLASFLGFLLLHYKFLLKSHHMEKAISHPPY